MVNFYELRKPSSECDIDREYGSDCDKTDHANYGSAVRCPECGRILTMRRWLPPFEIEVTTYGRHYADILHCISDVVASDRFIDVFRKNGLTGFDEFLPVQIIKLRHRRKRPVGQVPSYFLAPVKISKTSIDQVASEYEWSDCSKICPLCLLGPLIRYKSQIVNQESWDGLDIFIPRGGFQILVSQRFVDACQEHDLKVGVFVPSDTASYDLYPGKEGYLQK